MQSPNPQLVYIFSAETAFPRRKSLQPNASSLGIRALAFSNTWHETRSCRNAAELRLYALRKIYANERDTTASTR
jgi:hypothetical protein